MFGKFLHIRNGTALTILESEAKEHLVLDVHMRRLPNILVFLLCLMIVKECSENCKKLVRNLQRLSVLNLTNILQFAHETTGPFLVVKSGRGARQGL